MEISDYAMIKIGDTEVLNTIVADEDFSMEGYYFIKIELGVFVTIGMSYNEKDNSFS